MRLTVALLALTEARVGQEDENNGGGGAEGIYGIFMFINKHNVKEVMSMGDP